MTKKDIVLKIAADTGIKQVDVKEVVQRTLMQAIGVVAIIIVLKHYLPVPFKLHGCCGTHFFRFAHVEALNGAFHCTESRRQGTGSAIEIYKHESLPDLGLQQRQPDLGFVKIAGLLHCRRIHQCAVQ